MDKQSGHRIAAGIVVFHPNLEALRRLFKALVPQVASILVYDNGGFNCELIQQWEVSSTIEILGSGENLGIGEALNVLSCLAQNRGFDQFITFDQDSLPPADMIVALSQAMISLQEAGSRVAAVGPAIIDQRNGIFTFPIFQPGRFWIRKRALTTQDQDPIPTILLITSGMLLDLRAFREIGAFRSAYFIDYVDTEWCLRGITYGFTYFLCPSIRMNHELSADSPKRVLGRLVLKYSSTRRYYAFRNACFLLREKHCPGYMRIYLLATLIYRFFLNLIIDSRPLNTLQAMMMGLWDGVLGRGGRAPSRVS